MEGLEVIQRQHRQVEIQQKPELVRKLADQLLHRVQAAMDAPGAELFRNEKGEVLIKDPATGKLFRPFPNPV